MSPGCRLKLFSRPHGLGGRVCQRKLLSTLKGLLIICICLNICSQNPDIAMQRYGRDYKGLIRQASEALTAPPPVKTAKLRFSGFPANMGIDACKMTLASIGALVSFDCAQDEDFPILVGTVEFEDIESAKQAVKQYNGMNMGMGTALELESI